MKLNRRQKVILVIYAIVVLGLCVLCLGRYEEFLSSDYRYAWTMASVIFVELIIELFAATVVLGVAVVVTHKHS